MKDNPNNSLWFPDYKKHKKIIAQSGDEKELGVNYWPTIKLANFKNKYKWGNRPVILATTKIEKNVNYAKNGKNQNCQVTEHHLINQLKKLRFHLKA